MAASEIPAKVDSNKPSDQDNEVSTAKSAEDRKAAAALSSIEAREDDVGHTRDVDQEAVRQVMIQLNGNSSNSNETGRQNDDKKTSSTMKNTKLDPASIALIVDELELSKAKATELLRAYDGLAKQALRAYINPALHGEAR